MKKNYLFKFVIAIVFFSIQIAHAQDTSWFKLQTHNVNLDTALTYRMYVADINNDGYPDFITLKGSVGMGVANCIKVYINVQDSGSTDPHDRMFVDVTQSSGVNAPVSPLTVSKGSLVAALADVNNDGNIDIVRGVYYHRLEDFTDYGDRNEVLLGDGMGHFTIKPNNGLHELGLINTSGFSFLDYNKDGKIDLFIPVWFADYTNDSWSTGYLMKGNGDGTFTNVTSKASINQKEPMYGSTACDWNNDGFPDIATAPYCRDGGILWKNNGNSTFTNAAVTANYNAQFMKGNVDSYGARDLCLWGAMPEDFDNDGDLDFFFCLIHGGNDPGEGRSTIVINGGPSTNYHLDWDLNRIIWKLPIASEHGDYDASWLDMENDGLEDIFMTQGYYGGGKDRTFIFHQKTDNTFIDVTQQMGFLINELKDTHQCEALDYDLDGDDDLLVSNRSNSCHLQFLKNKIGQNSHWTAVNLVAPNGVNKSCIGTRIKVYSGDLTRMRDVSAGKGNFGGQQPFSLIFGLGDHSTIDSIEIYWPNIKNWITTIKNPPIDQYLSSDIGTLSVQDGMTAPKSFDLKVYPNPAKDFILLQLTNNSPKLMNIGIYDLLGNKIKGFNINNTASATKYFSVKDLSAGSYIINVTTTEGIVMSKPFIKMK